MTANGEGNRISLPQVLTIQENKEIHFCDFQKQLPKKKKGKRIVLFNTYSCKSKSSGSWIKNKRSKSEPKDTLNVQTETQNPLSSLFSLTESKVECTGKRKILVLSRGI